jgi:phospholipase/carboxylesterase
MSDAARLRARPDAVADSGAAPGDRALLHVPPGARAGVPAALLVLLHGAGGSAAATLELVRAAADAANAIVLAPQSAGRTWDMIERGFGPDVERIDAALAHVFGRLAVDPARIALAGFSDGASYALSLGLGNGDLVTHLIAFSPGFVAPPEARGRPRIFVSHGSEDRVLPIGRCGRRVVARLRGAGYDVTYEEFDGGHTVPAAIAQAALAWFG